MNVLGWVAVGGLQRMQSCTPPSRSPDGILPVTGRGCSGQFFQDGDRLSQCFL